MCLTFFYLNPAPTDGTYKLILCMNRDEAHARKTSPAEWDGDVLCGRDQTPGKEGGTWLAVDKRGRVGLLTNILTGKMENEGKGRGGIIQEFLKGHLAAGQYLEQLSKDESVFNPFNVCLLTPNEKGIYEGSYYCRGKPGHLVQTTGPKILEPGCHGLGNHPMSAPFEKTKKGLKSFEDIVVELGLVEREAELLGKLSALMKSAERCFPDPQMSLQGGAEKSDKMLVNLSSIFIDLENYGTRTQTFILVDGDFNVTFVERNRPDVPGEEWQEKEFKFKVQ